MNNDSYFKVPADNIVRHKQLSSIEETIRALRRQERFGPRMHYVMCVSVCLLLAGTLLPLWLIPHKYHFHAIGALLVLVCGVAIALYKFSRLPVSWHAALDVALAEYNPVDKALFEVLHSSVRDRGWSLTLFENWIRCERECLMADDLLRTRPEHSRFVERNL